MSLRADPHPDETHPAARPAARLHAVQPDDDDRARVGALVDAALAEETSITVSPAQLRMMRDELQRFLLEYRFGLREIETKIAILRDEFQLMHDYNPIEHVSSRVKTPDSLVEKVARKGIDADIQAIREHITDIAGVRITCSFVADAYRLFDLLTRQDDVRVLTVKDYIAHPKENGYKSLHAIVEVPVFLSTGRVHVPVEVQFRTIAMDFWASLEHKIYYKYDRDVPADLLASLRDAADSAAELDERMQRLHREIRGDASAAAPNPVAPNPVAPYPAAAQVPNSAAHGPNGPDVRRPPRTGTLKV